MTTIRKYGWGLLALGCFTLAGAQEVPYDAGAGAEVIRGTLHSRALGIIQNDLQMQLEYRNLVVEQALALEAGKRALPERIDVQQNFATARRRILVQALKDDIARSVPQPKPEALQEFYQKNRKEIVQPRAVQLDVFRMAASNAAALARARTMKASQALDGAKLIADGAIALSSITNEVWHSERDLPPALWAAVTNEKEGAIVFVEQVDESFLLRRGKERAERPLSFDEAKAAIQMRLIADNGEAAWQTYIKATQKKLGFE